MASNSNVSVAIRIRPKLQREEIDMCNVCTRVTPGEPQVWLGHDKAFTFDHVFDMSSKQSEVYDDCVKSLVEGCFDGFNATVLAYGQTGSGKTYTMGTGFDVSYPEEQRGIIPRAVEHLYKGICKRQEDARNDGLPVPEFTVTAQFIEIYNEEIIDLLSEKRKKGNQIRIHEDFKKGISLFGVETKLVSSSEETLQCLKSGSLFRTTGATLMNAESSRSHAIFTLFIKQNRVDRIKINEEDNDDDVPNQEVVTLTAKFNFVDLAGSERLSRTGAVGERAREGISINSGLLHLGNVISALGDRSKKVTHIPYRDSKLTRVLQDSLGGNSVTTMIACISPCDRDFVETLNTLRYANRAKNIKNKVVANQDSQTQLINELRRQVLQLQLENQELRQGKLFVKNDGEIELNDVYHENKMLQRELNNANIRIKALNTRLADVNDENIRLNERIAKFQINNGNDPNNGEDAAESLIKGYLKEISNLRSKVVESEHFITHYRKQLNQRENELDYENGGGVGIIEKAKHDVELGKSFYNQLNNSISSADTNGNRFSDGQEDDQDDYSGCEDENDDDFERKLADHNAELANLMENLASKERLIEEFEARERRIIELTEQYEQKIASFKIKIKQIEEERDTLINKIKKENKDDHISKAKKEEYEKRLTVLQNDVRKYEALKREHQKILNQEMMSKERLKKMRQEIIEAKQQRVKLIAQMREQMGKHNKEMLKNRLMINKLTREDQKKIVKIRDLEVRSNQQKKMLQRREEEIKNLKKLVKPMSDRVAGRFYKRNLNGSTPQKARNKWHIFEQKFNKIVALRRQFDIEEKKFIRYNEDRQRCAELLNTLKENNSNDETNAEDLEALKENIEYLDQCIKETQNVIMQLEDENLNTDQLFNDLDPDEVQYIMSKLANSAINHAIIASQREEELKEKDANLNNLVTESSARNQLLNYLVATNQLKHDNDDDDDILPNIPDIPPSSEKFRRLTMTPSELLYINAGAQAGSLQPPNVSQRYQQSDYIHQTKNEFHPDNNGNKKDQLSNQDQYNIDLNSTYCVEKIKTDDKVDDESNHLSSNQMIQSLSVPEPVGNNLTPRQRSSLNGCSGGSNGGSSIPILNHVSSASSLKELNDISTMCTTISTPKTTAHQHYLLSPHLMRRKIHQQQQTSNQSSYQHQNVSNFMMQSSQFNHSHMINNNYNPSFRMNRLLRSASNNNDHQQNYDLNSFLAQTPVSSFSSCRSNTHDQYVMETANLSGTPPGSPSVNRRQNRELSSMSSSMTNDSDVFSRLTGSTTVTNQIENSVGQILPNQIKTDKLFPLSCTHTVVGHRRAVLSITATNEVLFSGSKDGTAKIWDLTQCTEVFSLSDHPDAVNVVRYDEYNKLIFTCSKSIIKIWDPRQNPNINCLRTLCSSGLILENTTNESFIFDMRLSADGSTLFSTAERLVRVWDLRTFQSIGKLNTGHKSLVTCLAVDDDEVNDTRLVITGSKDHTVKVFELDQNISGIHIPKYTLKPPHYDGIQALRLTDKDRCLFSGGRDGCIKKWNLTEQRCVASLGNCHRDWVLALDTFLQGSILLSACRSGFLRVWGAENCRSFGEIQAHSMAVNDIATIPQAVFTASNDCTINLWQHRESSPIDDVG